MEEPKPSKMRIAVERNCTQEIQQPTVTPSHLPPSDLSAKPAFPRKPPRRKTKTSGSGFRVTRENAKRNIRPETPLLRWKFDESNDGNNSAEEEKSSGEVGRKSGRRVRPVVSARNLGAGFWRLHSTEFPINGPNKLGLQFEDVHVGAPIHGLRVDRMHASPVNNLIQSPRYVSVAENGLQRKHELSFHVPNSSMEGATKWDPVGEKLIFGQSKLVHQRAGKAPVISALEAQLDQARARINELETERRSSKKKLEQFLQKLSVERATWRTREHEKIRAIIDDMKTELSREKQNRQRLEIVHSKLVNDLADAKLSVKRYLQQYEKERKDREILEEVCDELAKEIGEDKAEVEALKKDSVKLWEEVEEERKMLQMAEVWREERVQMKLVDAKVMLEEKYSQMNKIIADLEAFLNSRSTASDLDRMKNATEFLKEVAASINIQDIRELTYEPPNPDDMFSVFEDMNFGESKEREAEPSIGYSPAASHDSKIHTVTPQVKLVNRESADRQSNVYMDQSRELEDDASEWETVSHPEDQGSSYSPDGSDPSMNRSFRVSSASREWERNFVGEEETPIMEISAAGSMHPRQVKRASSISRLWKSCPSNDNNYKIISVDGNRRLSNGRLNGAIMSPDCGSGKDGLSSPQNFSGNRGGKGCIEWPRNAQKSSLKARLLEARMDSQKVQLRQVLKQKI